MGMGTDLVRFFHRNQKTVSHFLSAHPQYGSAQLPVGFACRQLANLGLLIPSGMDCNEPPPLGEYYSSWMGDISDDAAYGTFDFLIGGVLEVYDHFSPSVKPVIVTKRDGNPDMGSGFKLEGGLFVTAAHCVEGMKEVTIDGWSPEAAPLQTIWVSADSRQDIAILEFSSDPLPNLPGFKLADPQVLEDVLTMGYPPIPGFHPVLIAEAAKVSGFLQATTGSIVGESSSYLDGQPYILVSARVKGGNSGGPVISSAGRVVGLVAQLPMVDGRIDMLGYGVAAPAQAIRSLLETRYEGSARRLTFSPTRKGIETGAR